MKCKVIVAILCIVIVSGCAKNNGKAPQVPAAGDTTRVVDSTAETVPVQHEKLLSYEASQGALLYGKYCAVCHGEQGKGDGFNAYNLDPHPRDFSDSTYMKALSDDQILRTIGGGGRSVNKSPLMPAYGWTLSKQQIRYVMAYVRTFEYQ
jgi:mono/diheme cytochrome c family protein